MPYVAAEPERGPLAKAFAAWDALIARTAAPALGRLDAALSKYHGVSDEARMALRGYGGRREFSALPVAAVHGGHAGGR